MSALHPEALTAAYEAHKAHAADPGRKGNGIEKAISAYLAVAYPAPKTSPEEQSRFTGADGVPMVSVTVAQSFPFAKALAHEWSLVDGRDHNWKLKHKALVLPASIYDEILPKVRHRLRPGGLDE